MQFCLMLILCFCLIHNSYAYNRFQTDKKEWNFPFADTKVTIEMVEIANDQDDKIDYAINFIVLGKTPPTATEEAEFLKVVLQDMEKMAKSVQKIYFMELILREPDVSKKLATAAIDSPIWKKEHKIQPGDAVVKLLDLTDAYEPFNQVLKPYGMKVEVSHAEKICVVNPEKIGLKKSKIKVPINAGLEMYVLPINP